MSLTYDQAATQVARVIGGDNDPDIFNTDARDAIQHAIRHWNARTDWDFKLHDLVPEIPVIAGQQDYTLPAGVKRVHTARLTVNKRGLIYIRQRQVDRVLRDHTLTAIPTHYTFMEDSSGAATLRLYPLPAAADSMAIRLYYLVQAPVNGADIIDVPDRFQHAIIALAKYYMLVDRDAENARTAENKTNGNEWLERSVLDDNGRSDEDMSFIPNDEYGQAYGPQFFGYGFWPDFF